MRPLITLRARWIFPVSRPPIAHGTVTLAGDRIVAVGSDSSFGDVEDLGNVAILPALVNAHTHLDFSDLDHPIGEPSMPFVDWIRAVVAHRRSGTRPKSNPPSVERGLAESTRGGVATVGEIAQPGWNPDVLARSNCDGTVFQELIAPTRDRVDAAMAIARSHLSMMEVAFPAPQVRQCPFHIFSRKSKDPPAYPRWTAGLSPHAPYSVHPELLRRVAALSAEKALPIAMHLAESREELELLRAGTGPFRDLLESLNAWDPKNYPSGRRPLDYLHTLADAERALVVHGNYLDDEEIAFLAARRDHMSVVYCPRTHTYFGHEPYPLMKMLAAGVAVGLGTDSRASNPDLCILGEMLEVLARHPQIAPATILELATLGGARALGRAAEIGSLEPTKFANLAILPLVDRAVSDPYELLFDSPPSPIRICSRGKTGLGRDKRTASASS